MKTEEFESCSMAQQMLIIPNEIRLGDIRLTVIYRMKVVLMNFLNPEKHKRLFWVICGKIIKLLRKLGLWKKEKT